MPILKKGNLIVDLLLSKLNSCTCTKKKKKKTVVCQRFVKMPKVNDTEFK